MSKNYKIRKEQAMGDESNKGKSRTLTIMNYNVQMLPVQLSLTFNSWVRRKSVVEHIIHLDNLYDIDVLVLNEVFASTILKLLINSGVGTKFPHFTNVLGNKSKPKIEKGSCCVPKKKRRFFSFKNEPTVRDNTDVSRSSQRSQGKKKYWKNTTPGDNNSNAKDVAIDISDTAEMINDSSSQHDTITLCSGRNTTKENDTGTCVCSKDQRKLYEFMTTTNKRKLYHFFNGGVIVFSKHRILTTHALHYSNSDFPDSLSSKGAIYAKILIHQREVSIVATHLQAGEEKRNNLTRLQQIRELRDWVYEGPPSDFIRRAEPLFFVGDLNVRLPHDKVYLNIIKSKQYLDCHLTKDDLETTYDSSINDYCRYIERDYQLRYQYTLDYILVSNRCDVNVLVPQTAVQTRFKPLTFIKFLFSLIPYAVTKIHHPSDHFPIYAKFQI